MVTPSISNPSRRGFTLVEAVFSMLITAGLLVAALQTLAAATRREHSIAQREVALALAQDLTGEVLQSEYEDPDEVDRAFGPEPGETRAVFDDVDDYDGWVSSPPVSRTGDPLPGAKGFERRVHVDFVATETLSVGGASLLQDGGLKRVTVEAVADGAHASVVVLRGRHGNADREPVVETTYVRWVGITMQLGEDGRPLTTGTSIMNQVALEDGP